FGMVAPTGVTAWGFSGFGSFAGNLLTFDLGEPSVLSPLALGSNAFAGDFLPGDNSTIYVSAAGDGSNDLFSVDATTGAATFIGKSIADGSFSELAGDPTNGKLYASTPTQLYTIDPAVGTATPIGAF